MSVRVGRVRVRLLSGWTDKDGLADLLASVPHNSLSEFLDSKEFADYFFAAIANGHSGYEYVFLYDEEA